MDLRRRDLESLKARISFVESHLWEGSPKRDVQDDPPQGDADTEMSLEARATTLPLIMLWLQSLALILMRTLPWRSRSTWVLLVRLPPVLSL